MDKNLVCALAVLALTAAPARAIDHPEVKEGLWQIHMQFLDAGGKVTSENSSELCRSHAYDKSVEQKTQTMMGKLCSPPNESLSGNQFTSELSCKVPGSGSTSTTKAVVTFSGDTAMHSESHTTYTPPYSGMTSESMVQDQKYLGSCPAGMQPGDRRKEDGSIAHSMSH
jgi:hypothetical protein